MSQYRAGTRRPGDFFKNLALDAPLAAEGLARASAARTSDSLWNGALIGASTAVAGSLLLCRSMEPWELCRDDVGAMATSEEIGAGIGIAVDALIRRQASATSPADRGRRPDVRRWTRFLKIPARR